MANNNAPSPDDDGSSKTKMTLSLKSSGTGCNALVRKEVVEYWKSCSVLERISLTTIDKTTIIRKLKQRHKHRCSCENCMRRRVPYFDDEVHFYDQIVSILEKRDLETIDWDFEEKLQLPFCCHHAKDHQEQNDDNKEITSNEEEQSGIFLIFGQKLYIEEGMLKIHPKALAKQDLLLTILEKLKRVVEENHNMCEEQGKKEKNRTCEMCSACIAFEFLVCKAIVEKVSSAYNHRLAVMKAEQMVQVLLKEEQQKSKQKLKKKKKKKTKKRDQDNDEDEEDDDSNSVATMDSLNQFMNDDPVFGSLEDDNGSESSLMDYENGSSPTDLSQDIDDSFDVSSEHGDPFQDLLEFREKWEVVSKPRKVKQAPNAPSTSTSTSLPQSQVPPKTTNQPVPSRQNRKHQSKLVLPPRLQQQLLNSSPHQNRVQNYVPKESPVPEVSIPSATVFAAQVFHTTIPFSGQYHTSCFSLPTIFGQYNSTPLYASWVMNTSSDSSSSANSNRSDSLYFGILV